LFILNNINVENNKFSVSATFSKQINLFENKEILCFSSRVSAAQYPVIV